MSNKLLLEKLKVFYMKQIDLQKPHVVWKVTFRSEVTGKILEYETDSLAQAELFRETFHLVGDLSTLPQCVPVSKILNWNSTH